MGKTIEKKTWPEYFEKILSGEKTYDLRLADWDCQPGDTLVLREFDPKTQQYTGRSVRRTVGYVGTVKSPEFFSQADVEEHGYQIISLLSPEPFTTINSRLTHLLRYTTA